jgi:hypothetical protein
MSDKKNKEGSSRPKRHLYIPARMIQLGVIVKENREM